MPVRVHVQNFQSLQEAEIEIDGFTVVTGPNNSGKTAAIRAIRGVFQNTPGTAFIREGATTCQVTVDLGDHTVVWTKGTGKKDRPTYILDGGDPIYPGQAVPDEIAALGIVPIQAGGQEVWPTIAPQFTGQTFLLDKPGSAIAEAVADVERVGQLNRALRAAESDKRQAAAALKVRTADLVALDAKAVRFQGLDTAVAAVAALEERQVLVLRLGKAVQGLLGLRERLQAAQGVVAQLAPVETLGLPGPQPIQAIQGELLVLTRLSQRLRRAQAEVSRYTGVVALQVLADGTPVKRLLEGLKVLKDFRSRLDGALQRQRAVESALPAAETAFQEADAAVVAVLRELGQCPVCGAVTA